MGKKILKKSFSQESPLIFYEHTYLPRDIVNFIDKYKPVQKDIYKKQLEELFEIDNPTLLKDKSYEEKCAMYIAKRSGKDPRVSGNWVYFPWSNQFIHLVNSEDYFRLRTNRNRNLLTAQEQAILSNSCIGCIGLSIGSHFAIGFSYCGIASTLKLADFDDLSTTNLNRVRASLADVGMNKAFITAKQIYEINPYANLVLFQDGLQQKNIKKFLNGSPKPKIIFEAIDDFFMKIRLRIDARIAQIPVVMLTNLGDTVLVDIERYDQTPDLPLFNGLIGNTPEEILSSPIDKKDLVTYAVKIVGKENIPQRAKESLEEIHKILVGRPQLYSTVTIAGGIASIIAKKIILGEHVPSGRSLIGFDTVFTEKSKYEKAK